jgi:hypothetical protein
MLNTVLKKGLKNILVLKILNKCAVLNICGNGIFYPV